MKRVISATAAVFLVIGLVACNQAPVSNPNVDLAKAWVTANSTSRTAAMEMIEQNMADDGLCTAIAMWALVSSGTISAANSRTDCYRGDRRQSCCGRVRGGR